MEKWNNTLLEAFKCPYRGKHLRAIIKRGIKMDIGPISQYTMMGKFIHEFLAARANGSSVDDILKKYAPLDLPKHILDFDPQKIILETDPNGKNFNTELYLEADLSDFVLFGTIDLVISGKDKVTIIDYKTGPATPFRKKSNQLFIYALLYYLNFTCKKTFDLRYVYLYDTPIEQDTYTVLPDRDIPVILDMIKTTVNRLKRIKRYKPVPGTYCSWCEFILKCPLGKEHNLGEFTKYPIDYWIDLRTKLKAQCDAITELIKQQVELNGNIKLADGRYIGNHPIVKTILPDVPGLLDYLLDCDIPREDVWGLCDIKISKLLELIKKNEALDKADIEEKGLITYKKDYRFGLK